MCFSLDHVCGQMMEETGWTCSKHVSSDTLCHLQNLCVYGKVTGDQFLDQLSDH